MFYTYAKSKAKYDNIKLGCISLHRQYEVCKEENKSPAWIKKTKPSSTNSPIAKHPNQAVQDSKRTYYRPTNQSPDKPSPSAVHPIQPPLTTVMVGTQNRPIQEHPPSVRISITSSIHKTKLQTRVQQTTHLKPALTSSSSDLVATRGLLPSSTQVSNLLGNTQEKPL